MHLDVVHVGTNGDAAQSEGIAGLDVGLVARFDHVALLDAHGSEDVTLFTVGIVQKSNAGGTVGIVFDFGDAGGNAHLVALEVDDAVQTLMTAATATARNAAVVVAAALLAQTFGERLFRRRSGDLSEVGYSLETTSSRGRFHLQNSH